MTVLEATRENFRDLIAEGTVLVDVWGPDCRPCLTLMPHVEELANRHADDLKVVKLEAPKARRVCMELRVMSMPAFLLFQDGKEVARLSDPNLTAIKLTEWLEEKRMEVK